MARANRCKYPEGETTIVNGFSVSIARYTSAYATSATARNCARFWGIITPPDGGDVIESPDNGWTVGQIDKIVGCTDKKDYSNRGGSGGGKSAKIRALEGAIATNKEYGLPTDELESLLAQAIAEDEANRAEKKRLSAEERERIKAIKKKIKELTKAMELNREYGLDTTGLESKIAELQAEIESTPESEEEIEADAE